MVLERVLYERFPFNKNSSLKVWKFQTVHVMVHLVHFGYCSRKQDTKERNNFVIILWKGTFRSDRPKWLDRSKWTNFTTEATTYFCRQGGNCGALSLKWLGNKATPLLFFQGGIWKIVVNLQSEIFIPKWAVIISDHAGSLALQWITGWNNTIWADST